MSAPDFDSLQAPAAPPKSKAARNWLIGCGGCSLLAVLAFIGLVLAFKPMVQRWANDGKDPEKAWPVVQRLLPFEQRPVQAEVKFAQPISLVGMTLAVLKDTRNGAHVDLLALARSQTQSFDQLFDAAETRENDFANMSPLFDPVAGKLDVQGRSVRTLFGRGMSSRKHDAEGDPVEGSKLRIDLTDATGDHLCFQYELEHGGAPELEAAALEFLSEFKLWKTP
jgi:hypothetical protein